MKTAWIILLVSALTDFFITAATGVATGMAMGAKVGFPTPPVLVLAIIGGGIQAARTIQQALKSTPGFVAELKGQDAPVVVPATSTTPEVIKEKAKGKP